MRILIKIIICTIFSVYLISKFNIFDLMIFVPESLKYEVGLIIYNSIAQFGLECIEKQIDKRKAKIKFIFYVSGQDKDINTNPRIRCKESLGTANINCIVEVCGNSKLLKKCNLYLELPFWLSSQLDKKNMSLSYADNKIKWDLTSLVIGNNNINPNKPNSGIYKLHFISNSDEDTNIYLEPKLEKSFRVKFRVKLETNKLNIKNGGIDAIY